MFLNKIEMFNYLVFLIIKQKAVLFHYIVSAGTPFLYFSIQLF